MEAYSLYLHIPFCIHRCGYCDFNTYAGLEGLILPYVDALQAEIRSASAGAGSRLPVHTIFFGGGTPSLLPVSALESILKTIHVSFDLQPDLEVSLEANPGVLSLAYLKDLRSLGVNRLSLGVQSAHPAELLLLERQHDYPAVIDSFTWARRAGFDNINLDLIFGLPEQHLETWQRTLELVLGLEPEHLSIYALSLEHGTPFGLWARRGVISTPDPDLAAEMYELADEILSAKSYAQYEISNWARLSPSTPLPPFAAPALACRHNLQYWRSLPYLGFGAGAHGFAASTRTANVLSPAAYIERLSAVSPEPLPFPRTAAAQEVQVISPEAEIGEMMMMGLRLTREGVSSAAFSSRFRRSLTDLFRSQIDMLEKQGLLEQVQNQADLVLRLTPRGRLLGNRVFMEFI